MSCVCVLVARGAGIGGGQTGDLKTPAQSSYNVAASPYWGVGGVYSTGMDPWQNWDNRQFMQNYYQLTTEYAKRGGISYPVSIATYVTCRSMMSCDCCLAYVMRSYQQPLNAVEVGRAAM
jgi:hypothetical protein